jgi:hypothetical protein
VVLTWTAPEKDGGSPLIGYYIYYKLTGTNDNWSISDLLDESEV